MAKNHKYINVQNTKNTDNEVYKALYYLIISTKY